MPVMEACAARWLFRETLVAHFYGLRTVGCQGVLPGGSEAILSRSLSYLLALHGVRLLAVLSERAIGHEQNEAGYKHYSRHGWSISLLDAVRYSELANGLLVASRTCPVRPLLLDGLVHDPKLHAARVGGAPCKNDALEGLWKVASILKHSHKNALRAPLRAAYPAGPDLASSFLNGREGRESRTRSGNPIDAVRENG